VLTIRNTLGSAYRDVGRMEEAILLFERSLAARTLVLGPSHRDTINTQNALDRARESRSGEA